MSDEEACCQRCPRWVYREGAEPDYRFSFANERTFLAWIRTGLAMMAAGVAIGGFDLGMPDTSRILFAGMLITCGIACDVTAWFRWAHGERAMRLGAPLPGLGLGAMAILGLTVLAVVGIMATVATGVA